MAVQYLAANRFGLGRRFDDPAIGDPKAWLNRQLGNYDPAPAALAGLAGRAAIATAYVEYREDRQAMRRAAAAETPMSEEEKGVDPELRRLSRSAIRPHIMGKFADLLIAAVKHPAMLLYLDQAQSFGPDSAFATRVRNRGNRQAPGLNENLAREILELHTLGVRTGYTQADVTAFAKALTGLTVAGLGRGAGQRLMPADAEPGATVFIAPLHEPGAQTVLGRRYDAAGAAQAEAILRDLAAHPATARHIATKLARHFTADDPPAALVDRLAADFLKSGGDLASLYRTLVASPEPWAAAPTLFKSPWDWTVSMLRALKVPALGEKQNVVAMFTQLGQPVWRPGSPAGYDDKVATWAGSAGLMQRVELASRIAGRIGDRVDARQLAPLVLADALTPQTGEAIARADSPGQGIAMLFSSPMFLRR